MCFIMQNVYNALECTRDLLIFRIKIKDILRDKLGIIQYIWSPTSVCVRLSAIFNIIAAAPW